MSIAARVVLLSFSFSSALAVAALAPEGDDSELTLERIMAHPDWLGRQPEDPYWADDGQSVYYERKVEDSEERLLYEVGLDGTLLREIPLDERGSADAPGGDWSSDRRKKVFERSGDVFVHDLDSGQTRQLTRTEAEESDPRFLEGNHRIAYHREDAIFVRDLSTGLELEPAVLRFEEDPDEEEPFDYLRDQQDRLVGYVRESREEEEAERERERRARRNDPTRPPPPFYLGEDVELKASSLSPDGRHMVLLLLPEERDDGERDTMPEFVTEDAYVEAREVRPLVGTREPVSDRVVLLDLVSHEMHEISLEALPGIDEDPLAELRKAARQRRGEEDEADEAVDEDFSRPVRVGASGLGESGREGILWSDDGAHLVLHLFSHDNKDRWIAEVDLDGAELHPLERMTDEAWINWDLNEIGFLRGSSDLFFTSEESGYSQLYRLSLETGDRKRLTTGEFTISDVVESPDGPWLYYRANSEHPGIYEVFRYDLQSGRSEAVTDLGGRNEFLLSPRGDHVLVTHSEAASPPELYVQEARPSAEAARITRTISDDFARIDWTEPDYVAIPSSHHDRPIYSRVYRPSEPSEGKRPAVVFVHGAGYLQNAHQGWSSYFREFMFHTLLTRRGYVVLDMDYRASAGYGRDWRTAIYRRMGTPELEDLEDGVRWLAEHENVDPERVGVYGGSYGGFITFMALFKEPDLFACGAALRPVTDWAHYNHAYTSRILNTPDVDPEAYERSSPIEFAEGLTKPLLIAHGMVDDNVFFKDTVRLVQRLIELEKENWETAIYPVEPHGFVKPSSWLDEYRRILRLFDRCLAPEASGSR